jgi:hypothetical protein
MTTARVQSLANSWNDQVRLPEVDYTWLATGPKLLGSNAACTITLPLLSTVREGEFYRVRSDGNFVTTINTHATDGGLIETTKGHSNISQVALWHNNETFQCFKMNDTWRTIPEFNWIPEADRTATAVLSSGSDASNGNVNLSPHVPPGAYLAYCNFLFGVRWNGSITSVNANNDVDSGTANGGNRFAYEYKAAAWGAGNETRYGGMVLLELEDDRDATYEVSNTLADLWIYEPWGYWRF